MFGLLLLYFIGKYYYNLAARHNKSKWPYAFLGIGTYYACSMVGGVLLGLVLSLVVPEKMDTLPTAAYDLMALPIGLLGCWAVYSILQSKWQQRQLPSNPEILDDFEINK